MRSKHQCEDTLLSICRSYGISSELYKSVCAKDGWGPRKTPPEAPNALCVFEAMLEAGVRFPLHELYNKALTYFNLAPSQLVPNAWRQLAGFVLVCEDLGMTPMLAVFRYYFKLHPIGNDGWYQFKVNRNSLFKTDGGSGVNTRWKESWFFLDSLKANNPWRCPQEWGTPTKGDEALQFTMTAWNAIEKLDAVVKESKGISLKKLIIDKSHYNHKFPVLPPLQEQVVKSEPEASNGDCVMTPSPHPPKRPRFTAPPTSSAPPGYAYRELRLAKENLASEQAEAARAKALEELEAEQSKTRELTGQLQTMQAERDKALMQLKEMGAELTVRGAAQAQHTARVRQLEAEYATKVSHLTELLRTEESMHMAKVQRLEKDLQAAEAEYKHRVCQLRNAFEVAEAEQANRLVEERKEAETNLQRLAEELEAEKAKHAAEVNDVRAQCYSQIKAAAIKCINELMPEPLPVVGVTGSKVADTKILKEPATIKQVELMSGEKTQDCETDPLHSLPHFERRINKNKMDAVKVIEASTKPVGKTKNTVTKTAAASEKVEELMAA